MVVRYGERVPPGFLAIYSVDTEKEAKQLLAACCQTNMNGEFVADELLEDQTIPNLMAFGERLKKSHALLKKGKPVLPSPRLLKLLDQFRAKGSS